MKGENLMKTKEELNALKKEVVTLREKLHELTEEELEQVTGGIVGGGFFVKGEVQFKKEEYDPNYHNHLYFIEVDDSFK